VKPLSAPLIALTAMALVALAPAAHAQDSAASASLSFNVVVSSPTGLTWLTPDSFSTSEASTARFESWSADGFGGFSPIFGPTQTATDTRTGLWLGTTSALTADGLSFTSTFSFAPSSRQASLQATASVVGGGFGNGSTVVRSFFSLAPGASISFNGALSLATFGNNLDFPASYTTTDLYGYAEGLLAVGTLSEDRRSIGNALLPYTAGSYAFNEVAGLSVSLTNTGSLPLVAYLDSGVAVYTASAVPEPGTYALMLAGLAAVGALARRRHSTRR
jgi:hypothetical protein